MSSVEPDYVKACVIGDPVAHSKSPLIHNHWIQRYGLAGRYGLVNLPHERLREGIEDLVRDGYAGFNVTIPHKQNVFSLCDVVDDVAREIGAVNTVTIVGGKLYGTNTDSFGFIENLRQTLPSFDFRKGTAVVLGAGGAARAILHGLREQGVPDIVICNRTRESAENLAAQYPGRVRVSSWEEREEILKEAGLLINSTALGMRGKDPLDLSLTYLPKDAAVYDIVYVPLMTDLLQVAKHKGNSVVTGIGMLLHQARPAFAQWFGVLPDVDQVLMEKVLA